jgi:hypothetical protein
MGITRIIAPVINGYFQEPYTPIVGRVRSASLAQANGGIAPKLEACWFILSAAANVTFKDYAGNQVTAFGLPQGIYPFPVQEISVVSTGSVLIVHDGLICQTEQN